MNYCKQVSSKELSLFHKYIDALAEGRQSVIGIKCLLYAHDLVLWYEIPKKMLKPIPKKDLNAALDMSAKLSDTGRLQYRKKWHSSSHCLIKVLTIESTGRI